MKNLALLSVFFLSMALSTSLSAQKKETTKWEAHTGVGLLPTFFKDKSKVILPPITADINYMVSKKVSLGIFGGYSVSETEQEVLSDSNMAQWSNKYSAFGLRLAAHTTKLEDWDIYGGLIVGFSVTNIEVLEGNQELLFEQKGLKENSGQFLGSAFLGARYHIAQGFGIYGEVGFAVSLVNLGFSYQF